MALEEDLSGFNNYILWLKACHAFYKGDVGGRRRPVGGKTAEQMAELIESGGGEGSKYLEYPGGGHVLFETNPESVDDMVEFLDDEK